MEMMLAILTFEKCLFEQFSLNVLKEFGT